MKINKKEIKYFKISVLKIEFKIIKKKDEVPNNKDKKYAKLF